MIDLVEEDPFCVVLWSSVPLPCSLLLYIRPSQWTVGLAKLHLFVCEYNHRQLSRKMHWPLMRLEDGVLLLI